MKYRVWNPKSSKWITKDNKYVMTPEGSLLLIVKNQHGTTVFDANAFWSTELELSYSINMKDKDGIEIYTGDYLKNDKDEVREVEINWCGNQFISNGDSNDILYLGLVKWPTDEIVVIGNKYENPDLLWGVVFV